VYTPIKKILLIRLHATVDVKTIEDDTTVRINKRHLLSMTVGEKKVLTCFARVYLMSFISLLNCLFSTTNSNIREGDMK